MRRFSRFSPSSRAVVLATGSGLALLALAAACSTTAEPSVAVVDTNDAAHRDGPLVEPADGGTADGPQSSTPECSEYCDAVTSSCTDDAAQYGSRDECLQVCALLPLGMTGDSQGDSIACREFYAGSAAKTDSSYCPAAGPFGGGGQCGDRCPIFCELALSACTGGGEAGAVPYASYSDCQTACVGFGYVDGGLDGGGESTSGPEAGNTLNCRLFYLRQAITSGGDACENLAVDSPACK